MLHLLTESQKNKVTKEYKMRLVIVVSWMIIFISLTGMALTLPIYLISVSKINHIKNDNQSKENSTKALRDQNFQDKIKQVNSSLGALKMFVGVPSPRNTYLKIVDSLPEGVYIDRYTYGINTFVNTLNNLFKLSGFICRSPTTSPTQTLRQCRAPL